MPRSTTSPAAARRPVAAVACALVLAGATACTDNVPAGSDTGDPRRLTVQATDDACTVSAPTGPSGRLSFTVTNNGSKVTEFYLLGEDGLRIAGEVENIGPGLSRELVLNARPGKYFTACKPGMVGDGIRSPFVVSDSGEQQVSADDQAMLDQANTQYQLYVKDQVEQLLAQTTEFAELYKAGKDDQARALYPKARMHWERVETVAESFGDLDPKMDAREADVEEGEEWTGWHRMEKDLWPQRATEPGAPAYTALTPEERAKYADDLVANTQTLYDRSRDLTFTADQIGNGAKGLLDEVATGKVTGEEEYWSRTDLWDFQGNVEGAKVMWQGLSPLLQTRNPELDQQLAENFDSLQKLLDTHRAGDGFKTYDQLTEDEVKQLSDAVNALSEPLSQLTAAVV